MNIQEIKQFFSENKIPKDFKISRCETIIDTETFIANNIYMIEKNENSKWKDIYLKRVLRVIDMIKKESQT